MNRLTDTVTGGDSIEITPIRRRLGRDEDRAVAAIMWANGTTQKKIAQLFGLKAPASVCLAIRQFILDYGFPTDSTPDPELSSRWQWHVTLNNTYADERKKLVARAIAAFVESRNRKWITDPC